MTAYPASAAPRGWPLRPMLWVTWRQHRAGLAAALALLGGFAAVTLAAGLRIHAAYGRYLRAQCGTAHSAAACYAGPRSLQGVFVQHPLDLYMSGIEAGLHVLPAVFGMFLGAPLLARELEAGTFRFAWTQGAGRTRWVLTRLVLLALFLTLATGALGVLAGWAFRPEESLGLASSWQPGQFDVTGPVFATWTLFAFAFGAFAGAVIRRTVPAMAVTATAVAALATLSFWKLDPYVLSFRPALTRATANVLNHYMFTGSYAFAGSTVHLNQQGPAGTWMVTAWLTGPGGQRLSALQVFQRAWNVKPAQLAGWAARRRLTFWWSYQPASRFWALQGIEAGSLLLLALILGAATVWLGRRAAAGARG